MSNQDMEMQFADPDWQPTQGRQSSPVREQPHSVPVEIDNFPESHRQNDQPDSMNAYNRDKAGDYADYSRGYQGSSSQGDSQEAAQKPRQKTRRRRRSLLQAARAPALQPHR